MADKKTADAPDQSVKKLVVSVVLLAVAGLLILVLQILPAQYGIDPTGFGTYIGLTKRYQAQQYYQQLTNTTDQKETVEIEVAAGGELEYKLYMLEGDQVKYHWKTSQDEIIYDFHGEPKGARVGSFESYKSGALGEESGSFTAPFEGTHGWYWRNDSDSPITVTLETQGKYSNVGIKSAAFSRK